MGFPAKFDGTCIRCGKKVHGLQSPDSLGRTQLISWNRKRKGLVWHVNCEDPWQGCAVPKSSDRLRDKLKQQDERSKARRDGLAEKPEPEPDEAEPKPIVLDDPPPDPPPVKVKVEPGASGDALAALAAALAPYLSGLVKSGVDAEEVKRLVSEALGASDDSIIERVLERMNAPRPIKLEVSTDGGREYQDLGLVHCLQDRLMGLVAHRRHAYLWGSPGTGKSTAAALTAKALDLTYGYISLNPRTPDSKILGYLDANGVYHPTEFRKSYESGGVFCIDELDNASAALLTTLNSCLENGLGAFPDRMVPRHADFVLIGTGNTAGRGGSERHMERRPFDAAFAERFVYLAWPVDEGLERAVALSRCKDAGPWVDWVVKLRRAAATRAPRLVVSPRASIVGAELLDWCKDVAELAECCVFKGLDAETVRGLVAEVPYPILTRTEADG